MQFFLNFILKNEFLQIFKAKNRHRPKPIPKVSQICELIIPQAGPSCFLELSNAGHGANS